MKILQIHNHYKYFGGSDRVALSERELLLQHGHDVIVFEKFNRETDNYGLVEKAAFFPRVLHHGKNLDELEALVCDRRPDVAHVHNVYPLISIGVYPLLKRLGIPSVQSFHDHRLALLCPQANAFRNGSPCTLCHHGNYWHAVRTSCVRGSLAVSGIYAAAVALNQHGERLARNLTLGIVFNEYMRNKMRAIGFPEEKLKVKPHFVQEDPGAPTYLQENYGVFMGAVAAHKGIFTLLKAMKNPLPSGLKIKIIGDGEAFQEVQALIEREGLTHVEALGFMSGVERLHLLKRARFSVVPSECFETFGMSIVESFACGVPVIGANIGAIPDLVLDRETGLLFNHGDAAGLRRALEILDGNKDFCLRMGTTARQLFEREYTADRNYEILAGIYDDAIATFRRSASVVEAGRNG